MATTAPDDAVPERVTVSWSYAPARAPRDPGEPNRIRIVEASPPPPDPDAPTSMRIVSVDPPTTKQEPQTPYRGLDPRLRDRIIADREARR